MAVAAKGAGSFLVTNQSMQRCVVKHSRLSASAVRTMPRLLEGIGFAANISREETARNAHSFVLVATLSATTVQPQSLTMTQ